MVQGGRLSYGSDGVLAVCDESGFYMVQNLRDVRRLGDNTKPTYQGDGMSLVSLCSGNFAVIPTDKNDAATTCVLRPNDNRFLLVDRYLGWGRQLYVWDVVVNDTLTIGHMSGRLWDGPFHTHAGARLEATVHCLKGKQYI